MNEQPEQSSDKLNVEYKNGKLWCYPKEVFLHCYQRSQRLQKKVEITLRNDHVTTLPAHFRLLYSEWNRFKIKYSVKGVESWALPIEKPNLPKLFSYQQSAVNEWMRFKKGRIEIPTGGGKTVVAAKIIAQVGYTTVILVPTIDLLHQWTARLTEYFANPIGQLGDGQKQWQNILVSTYDSAAIYAKQISPKYALLILDEVHHASSFGNLATIKTLLAPYRLGLSATMPSEEEKIDLLNLWVGNEIYRIDVAKLTGQYLANFVCKQIYVDLDTAERTQFEQHRQVYLAYRKKHNIPANLPWRSFVFRAFQSQEGKQALESFKLQKAIALNAKAKISAIKQIFATHQDEKILIFTNDNTSARLICDALQIPLFIHNTKKKERKELLEKFKQGEIRALVSSRVLNEGIDIPDASVAIIYSGNATIREQAQRLGRVLRKQEQKQAILYEIITADTPEESTAKRRNAFLTGNNLF